MKVLSFLYICIALLSTVTPALSQSDRMADQIRKHKDGTAVWWAGHNSWIIKSEGLVIATDLYLENSGRINSAPITPEELAGRRRRMVDA